MKLRLLLAAALFAAWLGWLAYLSTTTRDTIVLSRAQFLVSSLDVIAEVDRIDGDPPQVTVTEVHWPRTDQAGRLAGTRITVTNLPTCTGWSEPGRYIVPLVPSGKNGYQVAPMPPSPGFDPGQEPKAERPHIYKLTPQTRRQLASIQKVPA